jgi:hypothetical protein
MIAMQYASAKVAAGPTVAKGDRGRCRSAALGDPLASGRRDGSMMANIWDGEHYIDASISVKWLVRGC